MNITLFGAQGIGKSTLADALTVENYTYSEKSSGTIGVEHKPLLSLEHERLDDELILQDTSGNPDYKNLLQNSFKSSVLGLCALTRERIVNEAENDLTQWIRLFQNYAPNAPVIFVVTQCDNNLDENKENIEKKLKTIADDLQLTIPVCFTSAKNNLGIKELKNVIFDELGKLSPTKIRNGGPLPSQEQEPAVSNHLLLRFFADRSIRIPACAAIILGILALGLGTAPLTGCALIGGGVALTIGHFFARKEKGKPPSEIEPMDASRSQRP